MYAHVQQVSTSEQQDTGQIQHDDWSKSKTVQIIMDPAGIKDSLDEAKKQVEAQQQKKIISQQQQAKSAMSEISKSDTLNQYNQLEGQYKELLAQSNQQQVENLSSKYLSKHGFVRDDNYVLPKFNIIPDKVCKERGYKLKGYMDLFEDK
jgi:hypothetical protein